MVRISTRLRQSLRRRSGASPRCRPFRACARPSARRRARAARSARAPPGRRAASPTTDRSSCDSSTMRNPIRSSGWSSTSSTVDAHAGPLRGSTSSRACTRQPPPWAGPASTVPPNTAARWRMPVETASPSVPRGRSPLPSSLTSTSTVPFTHRTRTSAATLGPRVLERVGERLLHDPVGGQLHSAGSACADRPRPRARPARRPCAPVRPAGSSSSMPGCGERELGVARRPSTPSSRRISVSASRPVRDTFCIAAVGLLGRLARGEHRSVGERDHHGQVVRDDVVHLPCDPRARSAAAAKRPC